MDAEVIIVGAGVIGLAAAKTLSDRGIETLAIEKTTPGCGQSHGPARIFRRTHADPQLLQLAKQADELWEQWQEQLQAQLLRRCGAVYIGANLEQRLKLLSNYTSEIRVLGPEELLEKLPLASPPTRAIFDPQAGSLHPRVIIEALVKDLGENKIIQAKVKAINNNSEEVEVETDARSYKAKQLIVCAGAASVEAGEMLGLQLPITRSWHTQALSYSQGCSDFPVLQDRRSELPYPAYGLPDSHGNYMIAFGGTRNLSYRPAPSSEELGEWGQQLKEYAAKHLGLQTQKLQPPQIITHLNGLPSDAFRFWRHKQSLLVAGNNLFKMAPAIGTQLADLITARSKADAEPWLISSD